MKKVLIVTAVLIGMMASAMVFSSFKAPKEEKNTEVYKFISNDDEWFMYGEGSFYTCWSVDGVYYGGFYIWKNLNSGNHYYVGTPCGVNPEDARRIGCKTGQMYKNRDGDWLFDCDGITYKW